MVWHRKWKFSIDNFFSEEFPSQGYQIHGCRTYRYGSQTTLEENIKLRRKTNLVKKLVGEIQLVLLDSLMPCSVASEVLFSQLKITNTMWEASALLQFLKVC